MGQVSAVTDMAPDAAGNLYVAESVTSQRNPFSRIQMRSPGGVWTALAVEGTGVGQVRSPVALAVDGAGNLYVAESNGYSPAPFPYHRRVQMRDAQGHWSVIAPQDLDYADLSSLEPQKHKDHEEAP